MTPYPSGKECQFPPGCPKFKPLVHRLFLYVRAPFPLLWALISLVRAPFPREWAIFPCVQGLSLGSQPLAAHFCVCVKKLCPCHINATSMPFLELTPILIWDRKGRRSLYLVKFMIFSTSKMCSRITNHFSKRLKVLVIWLTSKYSLKKLCKRQTILK